MREDGPVEWASSILPLLGAYCCVQIILLVRKLKIKRATWTLWILGALFFFVGAEEISWGQRIIGWVPLSGAESGNLQREFNFHNLKALRGPRVLVPSFVLFFLCTAILPLWAYASKSFKKFWLKTGAPLMPPAVCAGLWMGFIFLAFLRHLSWIDGRGIVYTWNIGISLQEWREFYYAVPLFGYVFADYFNLLKYGSSYDFARPKNAPAVRDNFLKRMWSDGVFLFFNNKALVIFVLAFLFIGGPLLERNMVSRTVSDLDLILRDPRLVIVQGEDVRAHNSSSHWFSRDYKYFGGKCLFMTTSELPPEGFHSFVYHFSVEQDGTYTFFVGSSPPGPLGIDRSPNHSFTPYAYSPYSVSVDGGEALEIYQEKKDNDIRKVFKKGNFYSYYNYASAMAFTKLGVLPLKKGPHTIEFRISKTQPYASEYVFGLDAVFIVPQNWTLEGKFKTLPEDIFSY